MGKDFRAAYLPGVTLTGAGQTVGLLEFDGYYASDISTYESAAGLPSVPLQNVLLDSFKGSPVSVGGDTEVSLDIEMAVSMAPGLSKIVVFEGNPSSRHFFPNDVLSSMASNPQISQFSSSWGWSGGPSTTTDGYFQTMMAQGQSFFNAAGDSDAFTVGATSANGVDNTSLDNAPSSSPYITQVGGTTLTTTGPGGAWSSETVWNWGDDNGTFVGTSGGISSHYGIPSWQASVSMSANGGSSSYRNIPDVAMAGDNIYVAYDNGKNTTVGGTSCAAPLWAGLAALMNQQALAAGRSTVGFINPALYALGASANHGAAFHDIITGNNTSATSPNNYYAVTGYDLCSGWGTPAGQSLINALAGVADPLEISPATGFSAAGYAGGPFTPNAEVLTFSNAGTSTLSWSVSNVPAWLTVTPTTGTLAPSASTPVTASLNGTASALPVGTNTSTVTIKDGTSGNSLSFQFGLQTTEPLALSAATGFSASGEVGGPFSETTTNVTLDNLAALNLNWTVGNLPAWLTVSPTGGTLAPNGGRVVTISLDGAASALPGGVYSNALSFNDVLGQTSQTIPVVLQVGQSIMQNGGFETGTFANWTLVGDGVSGNNIYNAVESRSSYASAVHTGTYGAFLGDVQLATLSQTLPTVPGHSYLLSFWLDNPSTGAGQQFAVNWITNAVTASQIYYITNPPVLAWTNLTFVLAATGTNTVLQFGAENAPNYFGFDDVSVTPIPNPEVRSLTRTGTSLSLTLYTVAGVGYQLLYATNLAQPVWTPLGTNMAAAATLTLTNNPGADQQQFYRVVLQPGN